jgi:hypothetical protein
MNKRGIQARLTAIINSDIRFPVHLKWLSGLIILTLLTASWPLRADDIEAQYLSIYSIIDQADSLNKSGKTDSAKAKYQEAQTALLNLKKSDPTWKVKVVAFRLKYVAGKIAALSQPPAAPAPDAEVTAKPESKSESKATPSLSTSQVKLIDAGAEPRKVLRMEAKAGDQQTLGMTLRMAMEMGVGDAPGQAMKMPAIKMDMEVTVKSVSADGDITYETIMGQASVADEPGVLPQVAEALKSSIGSVKGLSSTGTMSNRGLSKGTEMKLPPGANPQMHQAMEQMKESLSCSTIQFPEEAVGPGARWEVKLPLKSQGMTINQIATYQLVSFEGDRLTAKSTIVQQAANQKIQNAAMPELKVDVTKMTGRGTGSVTTDLAHLLPLQATIDSHSEMSMGMDVGGQKQTMTMKMDMNIRLETK